jgi:hypothetical protein
MQQQAREVNVGDIGDTLGSIIIDFTYGEGDGSFEKVLRPTGFVSVTKEQAERAEQFGWCLFGRNVMRPGTVTICRWHSMPLRCRPFEETPYAC